MQKEAQYTDIDKSILDWIEYFNLKWINCRKLIDYIKEYYVKNENEVVEEYINAMEIKVPTLEILNYQKICELDEDYAKLCEDVFLNIYRLGEDKKILVQEGLIE